MLGAHNRDRTGDLVLTKDVLCQLSYVGLFPRSKLSKRAFLLTGCRKNSDWLAPIAYPAKKGKNPLHQSDLFNPNDQVVLPCFLRKSVSKLIEARGRVKTKF